MDGALQSVGSRWRLALYRFGDLVALVRRNEAAVSRITARSRALSRLSSVSRCCASNNMLARRPISLLRSVSSRTLACRSRLLTVGGGDLSICISLGSSFGSACLNLQAKWMSRQMCLLSVSQQDTQITVNVACNWKNPFLIELNRCETSRFQQRGTGASACAPISNFRLLGHRDTMPQ